MSNFSSQPPVQSLTGEVLVRYQWIFLFTTFKTYRERARRAELFSWWNSVTGETWHDLLQAASEMKSSDNYLHKYIFLYYIQLTKCCPENLAGNHFNLIQWLSVCSLLCPKIKNITRLFIQPNCKLKMTKLKKNYCQLKKEICGYTRLTESESAQYVDRIKNYKLMNRFHKHCLTYNAR